MNEEERFFDKETRVNTKSMKYIIGQKTIENDQGHSDRYRFKEPFPKIGIFIVIISIFCIFALNNLPWIFMEYHTNIITIKESFPSNLDVYDLENPFLIVMFEYPRSFYSGLSTEDFTSSPKTAFYGLILWVIIGLAITILGLFKKYRNLPEKKYTFFHLILISMLIINSIFVIYAVIEFIGPYLIGPVNWGAKSISLQGLGTFKDVVFMYPTFPMILIIVSFITIIMSLFLLDSDLTQIQKLIQNKNLNVDINGDKFQ